MKKLTFLVTNGEYDKFISDIRQLGVIHVQQLQQGATSDELQRGLDLADRFKKALVNLDYAKDSYTPKGVYTAKSADCATGLKKLEEAEQLLTQENTLKHDLDSVNAAIARLEPWGDFSWQSVRELSEAGTNMYFFVVSNKLYKAEWAERYFATPISEQDKKIYFVAFADAEPDITAERLELPQQSLSHYENEAKVISQQIDEVHESLLALNAEYRPSILSAQLDNENNIQLSKVHLSQESIAEGAVRLMIGWTLAEKAPDVTAYLDKAGIYYDLEDPAFDDDVPIKLVNNKFSTLFEPILRMYSLPNYHDIDPLPLFAPFFMLFFGLCMGDCGYGLIITAISLYIAFTKPTIKAYGQLGALLGGMTCICGFITGTFFGIDLSTVDWDWIKPIQPYFINDSMKESFFGYSPMMVISVIIGLIQVLIGMFMAGCKAVKNYGFIYGVGKFSWVLALLSAVVLFGLPMFGVVLPQALQYVLYGLIAIAAFGIYFLNNPAAYAQAGSLKKLLGVGKNLGGGLWATYGMSTGLLGDLLSYIRLFALGLTGGVLGSVFNSLAVQMSPQTPVAHELVMILILLFGHGINFGLCMISSFVHPMRLTFVEYFKNANFDGNGTEYKPFKVIHN
ncbi:MAG: V-type ATP synthase subunit I [Bacteroidaceae bacterium]|nr:V-type ATP synthase subunit I [Bacteroidaceae bacterium]